MCSMETLTKGSDVDTGEHHVAESRNGAGAPSAPVYVVAASTRPVRRPDQAPSHGYCSAARLRTETKTPPWATAHSARVEIRCNHF